MVLTSFYLGSYTPSTHITNAFPGVLYQIGGCTGYTRNLVHALHMGLYGLGLALQDVELVNKSPRSNTTPKYGTTKDFASWAFSLDPGNGEASWARALSYNFLCPSFRAGANRSPRLELSAPTWESLERRRSFLEHVPGLSTHIRDGSFLCRHGTPSERYTSIGGVPDQLLCALQYLRFAIRSLPNLYGL